MHLIDLLRPLPAAGYVHPKSRANPAEDGQHAASLEIAAESSTGYLSWISELVEPHLGREVLEIGAGLGTITERYAHGRDVLATDVSDECVAGLRERFSGSRNVEVAQIDIRQLGSTGKRFDSALMINVLEHIKDDAGVLGDLASLVRPGGNVVVYVPALNGLYGAWDRKVGHFRRYSKWRMRGVCQAAGLVPQELRYANMLAIPAWMIYSQMNLEADTTVSNNLSLWDRVGVPLTRAIETRVRVPIGLNLLSVLQVP
jgi:SAM-dependent methyltransferase